MTDCNANTLQDTHFAGEREPRVRKLIQVDIEPNEKPRFPALVTDLSKHGMGGRTEGFLQAFELVTIVKEGYGRIVGEVRWTDGQNFGVLFAEPVNMDLFTFADSKKQQPSVQSANNNQAWKASPSSVSTGRPGVTNRFSEL